MARSFFQLCVRSSSWRRGPGAAHRAGRGFCFTLVSALGEEPRCAAGAFMLDQCQNGAGHGPPAARELAFKLKRTRIQGYASTEIPHGGTIIAQQAALSMVFRNCDASEARSYPPSWRSKKGSDAAVIELRQLGGASDSAAQFSQ